MVREYEQELVRLREENNQIRFQKDLRERDFENVIFENAQLQNKLENLENVFIGSSINRGGPGSRQHNQSAQGGKPDGISQDYTTSNLMIENQDLKTRVFNLEKEKIELL